MCLCKKLILSGRWNEESRHYYMYFQKKEDEDQFLLSLDVDISCGTYGANNYFFTLLKICMQNCKAGQFLILKLHFKEQKFHPHCNSIKSDTYNPYNFKLEGL